jgi:PBP superfamily domain
MDILEKFYPEYPCSRNDPLNCDRPVETAREIKGAKFCLDCGFPAILPLPSQIEGQQGNYQITSFLGIRGIGRRYAGTRIQDGQPVEITEYLLPDRCFSAQDIDRIKETFKKVAGVSLADGRVQNFRLVKNWEAIADSTAGRCYLVAHSLPGVKTLSQYLREYPAMNATQVREVLNQTFQTLEFLHTQKLRLPSNQIRPGLAHGNLSLDSILIEVKSDREFYIYLGDLSLWVDLFVPGQMSRAMPDPLQDLRSLGTIANYLSIGKANSIPNTSLALSENQQPHGDPHLHEFLCDLTGIKIPFENARSARLALLQLPQIETGSSVNSNKTISPPGSRRRIWGIAIAISSLSLIGVAIAWYLIPRDSPQTAAEFRPWYSLLPSFADINGVPTGEFRYAGEREGTWTNVLGLTPQSDLTLQEILSKPRSDIAATFTYQPIASPNLENGSKPIAALIDLKQPKSFVITSLTTEITTELDRQQIGYDGLLVFVAASKKAASLPKALKGQISLEQLRQIYTGKLTNWQQLGGINLPIKPYIPTEVEAVQLFKQLVLKDDPEDIVLFTNLATRMATEKTQQLILKEFDQERTGIVSFGILSKTWNQCSAYPLAIGTGEKPPVQVLFRQDGKPIDPTANLCDKNNYLDVDRFRSGHYPLGYPIFVVYPKDNRLPPAGAKFAELLIKTRQGQCLLSKVGLVPLQPMPDKYRKSNVCK